jgi:hypothetical protein
MPRGKTELPALSDFGKALLMWIQENHGGTDEVETIRVLSGFGDDQFEDAKDSLLAKALVAVRNGEITVTPQGFRVWDRLRGASYRAEVATLRLRQWIRAGNNCLAIGGNRQRRQHAIRFAGLDYVLDDRFHVMEPASRVDDELEDLGRDKADRLVVFHDVHKIDAWLLWKIRSVAQTQPHIRYVLEGSQARELMRKVLGKEAAFFQQLTVVDLESRGQRP